MSSGRVDLVSFVQINSENYQSRPMLPEDVPLAHTDSSVNLTTFCLLFCLIELLDFGLMKVVFCAGPSASRTASDVQDRAVDEPAVDSGRTRKQSAASTGSIDK